MNKKRFLQAVAVVAASVALIAGAASSAVAVDADGAQALATVQPSANTVGPAQLQAKAVTAAKIAPQAVWGSHLQPNTIPWGALGSQLRGEIRAAQGPIDGFSRIDDYSIPASKLMPDARRQVMETTQLPEPRIIANIGGPINTQGTKLGLGMKLPHGSWLVTVSGQINRTTAAATPGKQTQPQLSVWLDRNRDEAFTWQTEGDISPNGTIPDLAGRSVTVTGTTVLTINQSTPMDIDLIAHGYNNDQSGAGSGELTVVNAVVSAIPIAA